MVAPPLIMSVVPVIQADSSEARKRMACATSSGRPTRPSGMFLPQAAWIASRSSRAEPALGHVGRDPPGQTALTRTVRRASSAMFLVRRSSPPFAALYGAMFGSPMMPATDETWTTEPPRAAATIPGSAKRETRNGPVRSTSRTRCQSSIATDVTEAFRTIMPALSTRTSIPPSATTVSRTMRSASAGRATSPWTSPALPPAFSHSRTVFFQLRPPPAGDHDAGAFRTNSSAAARPIPLRACRGPARCSYGAETRAGVIRRAAQPRGPRHRMLSAGAVARRRLHAVRDGRDPIRTGAGQAGLDGRPGRRVGLVHPGVPRRVHLVELAHVHDVAGGGEELRLVAPEVLEHVVDLPEDLLGLALHARRRVVGDLARDVDRVTVLHALAQPGPRPCSARCSSRSPFSVRSCG